MMECTAEISDCGRYRYRLGRTWDVSRAGIAFAMLNPSTADANVDDPTIRRCIRFAQDWGFGSLTVVNLSPLRSPYPVKLRDAKYPYAVVERNRAVIREVIEANALVVAAWGAHPIVARFPLNDAYLQVWGSGKTALLGLTKTHAPRHPLYVPASTPLRTWR